MQQANSIISSLVNGVLLSILYPLGIASSSSPKYPRTSNIFLTSINLSK